MHRPRPVRYRALATDYDGTIATDGSLDADTVAALERFRASGRKVIMVTGRELTKLMQVCPRTDLFDLVVAENGAVLYDPLTREEQVLGEPPPASLVAGLRARGVAPLAVGRVIVATLTPHEATVRAVLERLGLDRTVILNKGSVMLLPPHIDKATGFAAALKRLGLAPQSVVGVGDAENDHAFLAHCGCAVAVANALPTLQQQVDWVTSYDHGAGVVELIERIIATDECGRPRSGKAPAQISRK